MGAAGGRAVRPGLIGKDGRTSALEQAFRRSGRVGGVVRLSAWGGAGREAAIAEVVRRVQEHRPDFVFVGPEQPLADGVVDALAGLGVPAVGPTRTLARLESSKAFTRDLLARHRIPGNPEHRVFTRETLAGLEGYLRELGEFAVKPDGLTGGKGVKVSGTHLASVREALDYAAEVLAAGHAAVVVEEKLDGEEFSLQSFTDGTAVVDMPPVQDHKRAFEGDRGPNTGGMGSYSCADHGLPFLGAEDLAAASAINRAVAAALLAETGERYRGILYGGFMVTADGVRLVEYNARFGDPESLNVLSLLRTDLVDVCQAILEGRLHELRIEFDRRATVCKYVVPEGYPDRPVRGARIDLSRVPPDSDRLRRYLAAVDERPDGLYMTGSRAIGFVGIAPTVAEAEAIAEQAAGAVEGPVYHRRDIGTAELIGQRRDHVERLRRRAR